MSKAMQAERRMWSKFYSYDEWMEAQGIPIYRGYYIEDLRTLELRWWDARECNSAFIQLVGQEGVTSARVTEIPPGKTLPPLKFALDEIVYVVEGRGLTTIWAGEKRPKKTFEWQKHSMFLLPHNYTHQFTNMQGDKPVRLLHYNYMPLTLSGVRDVNFIFGNGYEGADIHNEMDFYSEAKMVSQNYARRISWGRRAYWYGNFFPDMRAWDKLDSNARRGAGGRSVYIQFPDSEMSCHMSVFDARLYKKAHRHGPGRVIVIPVGEGYSIMWEEGKDKVVVPWHEASLFRAAEQMVSPALQRRRRAGALPGASPADAISWPCGKSRRPRQRPDRILQRRQVGARKVRRRNGKPRAAISNAARSVHRSEL